MMGENQKEYQYLPIIATTLIYISYYYLYVIDFISGNFFMNVLLVMNVMFIWFLLKIRRRSIAKRAYVFSLILSVLILLYESPLIILDEYHYFVTRYDTPEELIEGSGIFTIPVLVDEIGYVENEQLLRDSYKNNQQKFYEITPVDNYLCYQSKNEAFFEWIGLKEDYFTQMSINVKAYLKTSNPEIDEFLARDAKGNSAGLALVLSSFAEQRKFRNKQKIGVTGAIKKNGKAQKVGSIKEKVQIASEYGLTHIILPIENLAEANKVKKSLELPIEIIGVKDVDEAMQRINEINANQKK